MSDNWHLRIAQTEDLESIYQFELNKLGETIKDESERMMAVWSSKFRREALEHYLPMGWSFIAIDPDDQEIGAYFLAQPMLFIEGQTQSLWLEHIQFSSIEARDLLCELAYKLAREKHFQRVYFPNSNQVLNALKPFNPTAWGPNHLMLKTTRVSS